MGHSIGAAIYRQPWRLLISLACVIILAVLLVRPLAFEPFKGSDFTVYYSAALAVRSGENPYQAAAAWVAQYTPGSPIVNYYLYAPAFATLLIPLTWLPYGAASDAWAICSFVLLCFAIYALLRSAFASVAMVPFLLLVTAASLMSSVRTELFAGNVNVFLAACVCAAIWQRQADRPVFAGLLFALAAVTKPMLLGIVVFFLWKREFKLALSSLASFALLLLLPFLLLGRQALIDMAALWQFCSSRFLSFEGNVAPRGVLERLFNVNPYVPPIVVAPAVATFIWLAIAVAVLVLTLAAVAPRTMRRDGRTFLELGLIISAFLIMSPLTETTYLAFLIIPLVASVVFLKLSNARGWELVAASSTVLAVWLLEAVPRGEVERFFTTQAPSRVYVLIVAFVQQLYLLSYASRVRPHEAVAYLLRNCPRLASDWLRDVGAVLY